MKTFILGGYEYLALDCINGVLIDPMVPEGFWTQPIDERNPLELYQWYGLAFIVSDPNGVFKVYCLTSGAWDRPNLLYVGNDLPKLIELVMFRYD